MGDFKFRRKKEEEGTETEDVLDDGIVKNIQILLLLQVAVAYESMKIYQANCG
ncbi:hypothetical protein HanXRQr2_Chr02g0065071 [Helianthus annuus]|uniref:Uncharacterized protein n=1 Tax=Helianthus annuus TaxID=4232 RepID=A0A9K3P123_HELAN|nr:hypothetical protein HanXRQr2_Chr02g0065071 [Helianthus annuus]